MSNDANTLPPNYLTAEAAARPELDRPDHDHLEALLLMGVEECGRYVAASTDPDTMNALGRAARIVNPNAYVPIGMFNWPAIEAGIESPDPIVRRFAAQQFFIGTIGAKADGTVGAPSYAFPTTLVADGEVVYVPFVEGAAANTTVASVAAADAPKATIPPVPDATVAHPLDANAPGTIATVTAPGTLTVVYPDGGIGTQAIATDDPIAVLPVGSTITKLADATKIKVAHPATQRLEDGIKTIAANVHAGLVDIWNWLHTELAKL